MGNETKKTDKVKTNNKPETKSYTAKVLKVVTAQKADWKDTRVTIIIDKEIPQYKEGEIINKDSFSKNIRQLVSEIGAFVPEIQMADALALGRAINPQIIALALTNAQIEFKREYHAQGDETKAGNGTVYDSEGFSSIITKATPNINPLFNNMLNTLIMKQAEQPQVSITAQIPNAFNVQL